MSGHSKWSTIKHKKALVDAKKSKEFSKLARLIAAESKHAKGDVGSPGLKVLIDKAKAINMPKENIERAVRKGSGAGGATLTEVTYELYGPGGVAILVVIETDNNNRTNQEVKHLLSKLGYQLAEPGAASWAFEKKDGEWSATVPAILDEADASKLDELIGALLEHDDVSTVYTNAS